MKQSQMEELKHTLIEELKDLKEGLQVQDDLESTELSNYDNHPADNATDLTTQLTEHALDEFKEERIDKIEAALSAMEKGTYGKCEVCQKEIPFERLEAAPTTLTCKEHSEEEVDMDTRPVEEDIMEELNQQSLNAVDFDDDPEDFPSSDSPQDVPQDASYQGVDETMIREKFQ
ncbi:molecular chaperone DnaK [Lysinibacillus yapensis]|uniref:Molecular chaperone DnaK n=1 Tax=Ureibacillus yapensis TaxID=2304605 RepID=A0A396SAA4_9BACL|nr:TraR/DksA C4-type zinc finger protein [Lysinibacillus yapensis]RHW33281.1 molecular chaperone DnaK [Lysinibacillus yapensis]